VPAAAERDLAGGARVAYPACGAVAGDEEAVAVMFEDVDRCGVETAGLAACDGQDVAVGGSKPEPSQGSEEQVDQPFARPRR
jgi:hypothetical protein